MNPLLIVALLALTAMAAPVAADDDVLDFSDQMTPVCEVHGLLARPPAGWFSVPIESGQRQIAGCQMMLAREDDDALVGILRILSVDMTDADTGDNPWWSIVLAMEIDLVGAMGYTLGDVLWTRESVPVRGQGFANGRAIGLEAWVEGNETSQEAHFLLFDKGEIQYVVTLLTPGQGGEEAVYYQRNTSDLGTLISSFTAPPN